MDELYEEKLTAHGLVSPSGETVKELNLKKETVISEES